jgi:hypothetical protein
MKLDCVAVEIVASPFEESFSLEEYPEVQVLTTGFSKYQVKIGANLFEPGVGEVRWIANNSRGNGYRYIVAFKDGSTFAIQADIDTMDGSVLSSSGKLTAKLKCL